MSIRNTWITLVAGLLLAISLGGLSSHWVPTATSAYRVEASSYAKDEQDEVILFASNDTADIGTLQNSIANAEAELAKIKQSYDSAKQKLKWQVEFDALLNAGTTDLAAMLPSSSASTEELEKILNSPAQLKVNLPAIPEDQWKTPKAAESLGEEWVWIGSKENGFWVKKNESVTKPPVVDFKEIVKIAAVSPDIDQWTQALKNPEVLNMEDGKAEYLSDGTVIGMSDHLKKNPVDGFEGKEPMDEKARTRKTQPVFDKNKIPPPDKETQKSMALTLWRDDGGGKGKTDDKLSINLAEYKRWMDKAEEKLKKKKFDESNPPEKFAYRWIIPLTENVTDELIK